MKKSLFFILLCNLIFNDLLAIKIEVQYKNGQSKNKVEIKVDYGQGLKVVDINNSAHLIRKLNRIFSINKTASEFVTACKEDRKFFFILTTKTNPQKIVTASITGLNQGVRINCEDPDFLDSDYKIIAPENEADNYETILNYRFLDKEKKVEKLNEIKKLSIFDRPNTIYHDINGTIRQMPRGFFQVTVLVEKSDDQELKKDFYLKQNSFIYTNLSDTPLEKVFDLILAKEVNLEQYKKALEKIDECVCSEGEIVDEESFFKWVKKNNIDLEDAE